MLDAKSYSRMFCANVRVRGTLHPQDYMNSKYKIDEKTRYSLQKKEMWHFNKLQQGWFTIIVFLTSLFELIIFTLGYFGSDFVFQDNINTPIYNIL